MRVYTLLPRREGWCPRCPCLVGRSDVGGSLDLGAPASAPKTPARPPFASPAQAGVRLEQVPVDDRLQRHVSPCAPLAASVGALLLAQTVMRRRARCQRTAKPQRGLRTAPAVSAIRTMGLQAFRLASGLSRGRWITWNPRGGLSEDEGAPRTASSGRPCTQRPACPGHKR